MASSLSESEFSKLSAFIETHYGIKMPPAKKTMLESRLQKRLRALKIDSFSEYCEYVFSEEGTKAELTSMIDMVTTNKTDFFREPGHFVYLTQHVLPSLIQISGIGVRRPVRIWSAGCSSGEEPYTLAMVLSEFQQEVPEFRFSIFASDISSRVLDHARAGIYELEKIEPVSIELRKKYMLKSKDPGRALARMKPSLRRLVTFQRINLMDERFDVGDNFDVIFCRNVIIYFDRKTQEGLIHRFCRHLHLGGYLFLGHSETLTNMRLPLVSVAPTVYRRER